MNIGMFITSYFPDHCGGAEQQCRLLSASLVRAGHSVTILTTRACRDTPRRVTEDGVEVLRLPRAEAWLRQRTAGRSDAGQGLAPSAARESALAPVRRWAADLLHGVNVWLFLLGSALVIWRRRHRIDVWHAHVAGLTSGWCGFWAERFGIPSVCKAANLPAFPPEPHVPMKRWLGSVRRRMHFIALTSEMKDDLVARGVSADRVAVIPNGVSLPAEGPRPDPGESGTVLYVGNFTQPVANKAFDVLFDAWGTVHSRRPAATLTVAGGGDTRPWHRALDERGAASSVVFLGAVSDMAPLYRRALMLVLPSYHEGISNALLEAQSWGVSAVVSDIPGNTLVVRQGVNGLVVPAGDSEALAGAIVRLWDDAALRARLGTAARERIASDFDIHRIAANVGHLYAEMRKPS